MHAHACLLRRYYVFRPTVVLHIALNDGHGLGLGYETFIFLIAHEKNEQKGMAILD